MTINSQRLLDVQDRLEKLLTDKKTLNSKVTADAYSQFKLALEKVINTNGERQGGIMAKTRLNLYM